MTHPAIPPDANIWAIPLTPAFDNPADQAAFLKNPSISTADLPPLLRRHLPLPEFSLGDTLLWLQDDTLLAISQISYLDSDAIHWTQHPTDPLHLPLRPAPRFKARLLDPEEQQKLLHVLNHPDQFVISPDPDPAPSEPDPPPESPAVSASTPRPLHLPLYTRYSAQPLPSPRLRRSRTPEQAPKPPPSNPPQRLETPLAQLSVTPPPEPPPAPTPEPTPKPPPRAASPAEMAAPSVQKKLKNITICEIFSGPPGTGKTHAAIQRALSLLLPHEQIQSQQAPQTLQQLQAEGRLAVVTLHPNYAYESLVEGIRPSLLPGAQASFSLHIGPLKRLAFAAICAALPPNTDPQVALNTWPTHRFGFSTKTPAFVLVIDEINRGNLPQTLGETISLIEPSRRLGARSELRLHLHHSPSDLFALPPNLHILGTMNDADRSVAPLDAALRRRFSFLQTPPDPNVIRLALSQDAVFAHFCADIFQTLNARIQALLSSHHQLGHTPWLALRNLNDLRVLLATSVVPMLFAHFHYQWPRLCLTLGCPYDELARPLRTGPSTDNGAYRAPLILAEAAPKNLFYNLDSLDFPPAPSFSLNPLLSQPNPPPLRTLILLLSSILELDQAALRALGQALLAAPSSRTLPQ